MGDTQLRELLRVLGLTVTVDISNRIKEGRSQCKSFIYFAGISTLRGYRGYREFKEGFPEWKAEKKNEKGENICQP